MKQDRKAFGQALDRALKDQGRTQRVFATELADRLGRARPFNQATVTRWVIGENIPDPEVVFCIEELLRLPGGSLSRFLGYLPVEAVEAGTVLGAVEADVGLTALGRRVILKVYEELVDDRPHSS